MSENQTKLHNNLSVVWHWVINVVGAIALLLISVTVSMLYWSGTGSYYHKIVDLRIEPPVVKSGGPIIAISTIYRHMPENCIQELHRFVADSNTGTVVWSQIVPGTSNEGGHQISMVVPIPPLPPGNYTYSVRGANICHGPGDDVVVQSRQAAFKIVP